MSDCSTYLLSDYVDLQLHEVLQQPLHALLGVSSDAEAALKAIGIERIFDLGSSWLFANARVLAESGQLESVSDRVGLISTDLLKTIEGIDALDAIGSLPLERLRGLTDQQAADLKSALDLTSIRDLAYWPPRQVAHKLVSEAVGTTLIESKEDQAEELRPRLGEYPTERVYYNSLVMLQLDEDIQRRPLNEPVSLMPAVNNPVGFGKPAVGAILSYSQSWYAEGLTLGQMLHSLALAPGEATRIAVIDWSRHKSARVSEDISETEQLDNSTEHARALSEIQNAVADEIQQGGSMSSGWAESSSESKAVTNSSGLLTSLFVSGSGSGTTQEASTRTGAESSSWSVGTRSVSASMTQNVNDRTEQHANSVRNRRASAVREVSQSEHEEVSTRIVANYNHMHALTIQYYEVVQVYQVAAQLRRAERCLFVPFELLDFKAPNALEIVERFRGALVGGAISNRARALLIDESTKVEIKPATRIKVPVPGLSGLTSIEEGSSVMKMSMLKVEADAATTTEETTTGETSKTAKAEPYLKTIHAWNRDEILQVSHFFGKSIVRPNSDSIYLSDETELIGLTFSGVTISSVRLDRPGVKAEDNTFTVPEDSAFIDFSSGIQLAELDGIYLSKKEDGKLTGSMKIRCALHGRPFSTPSIPLDLSKGTAMQKAVSLQTDEISRQRELLEHLQANRAHYSQAVFRSLDSATLVMLLSQFTWNGKSLVDQVEPKPLTIAGNYVVFRAPVEPDEVSGVMNSDRVNMTWGEAMLQYGIDFTLSDKRLVPVPTGGVFAEAVLGRSNSAEKLDITRFWNWQDSPIPLQPPEIAPVGTGTRTTAENLTPGQLSSPMLNIVNPTALPDPSGLSASLSALASANMFRDMSGLQGTQAISEAALRETLSTATEAGQLASTNLQTEAQKAVSMGQIAADIAKAAMGVPSTGSTNGISADGARINHGRDMDSRGVSSSNATSNGSQGSIPGGGGSSGGSGGSSGGSDLMMGPPNGMMENSGSREQAYADQGAMGYSPEVLGDLAQLGTGADFQLAVASTSAMPTYDRSAALAYARKYWNRVPDEDGHAFVAISSAGMFKKVPLGTKFCHEFDTGTSCSASHSGSSKKQEHALLPNGSRINWAELNDCTHFLSCCIGEPPGGESAGGLPITIRQAGIPPKAPYGIVRVSTLVDYLTSNDSQWRNKRPGKNPYAQIIGEKSTNDSLINNLSAGDLIAYFSTQSNRYTHMAIYLGDNKIACHTYCRSDQPDCTWDNDWDLGRGTHTWTFIKITV